jgi:hypothetical protein
VFFALSVLVGRVHGLTAGTALDPAVTTVQYLMFGVSGLALLGLVLDVRRVRTAPPRSGRAPASTKR